MFCNTPLAPLPTSSFGPPGLPPPTKPNLHKYAQHASMNAYAQHAAAIQAAHDAKAAYAQYQETYRPAQTITPQQAHAVHAAHYSQQGPPANSDAFGQYHPQQLTTYDPNAAIPEHLMPQWLGQAARNAPLPEGQRGNPGTSNAWNMAQLEYGKSKGGSGLR
jgi:hypothetical protein